jgi:hypothetical protein
MNKYYFVYLIWLLPLYFLYQFGYQGVIYYGIQETYDNGESYVAEVTDFDVKQIAAQTNGYVDLKFTTSDGSVVEQRLALPIQMARVIVESELIPIRYNTGSFNPIVMMPVYELQRNMIRVNLAVTAIGLLVTVIIGFRASRYARRKLRDGDDLFEIERVDDEPQMRPDTA